MLQVTQAQLKAFQNRADAQFVDRLHVHLTQTVPEHLKEEAAEARAQIEILVRKGAGLGLCWESSLASFAELSLAAGPNADPTRWTGKDRALADTIFAENLRRHGVALAFLEEV